MKIEIKEVVQTNSNQRDKWSNKMEFMLSCIGYAVGLGNVWRFPYLCYKHGGAIFLIPYTCMLFLIGIPIFFLELCVGQFTSRGPVNCFKHVPLFKGVGISMIAISAFMAIYYNVIIAWAALYLFKSLNTVLPWEDCKVEWNMPLCQTLLSDATNCIEMGYIEYENGTCYDGTSLYGIANTIAALSKNIKPKLPAEGYFFTEILGITNSESLFDLVGFKYEIVGCLLLIWVIVFASMSKGIKSSGKVVYFTALFPYLMLVILFIRALTLKGALNGIHFYILNIKWESLLTGEIWLDAAVQIFFSLSAGLGGLITLASYNKFNNNTFRDALIIPLTNCATSFFAGFVIFGFLGFLAEEMKTTVDQVVAGGVGLAFIVYPATLSYMNLSPLWSILFFVMLITLGLDSEFTLVETVTTAIFDNFPTLKRRKWLTFLFVCIIFFVLALPMSTHGGLRILDILDGYSVSFNVLTVAILECILISYFYGLKNFKNDIVYMLSSKNFLYPVWATCWSFLTPLTIIFVFVFNCIKYTSLNTKDASYLLWSDVFGWIITALTLIPIPIVAVYQIMKNKTPKNSYYAALCQATKPEYPIESTNY
ncbi:hypothetical protein A3Q56_05532 [Intoshia linei]|uniref:Transporter n=1 Tax=Intoshia linei TaxID=1819745 RepID=A0A177AZB8_9BILA|nr:hypothetical protein A3Q56_05532 [Intoshia linei]